MRTWPLGSQGAEQNTPPQCEEDGELWEAGQTGAEAVGVYGWPCLEMCPLLIQRLHCWDPGAGDSLSHAAGWGVAV